MQFQLILLFGLVLIPSVFADDKPMKELFRKYELVMDQKKVEFIEDVFTKRFIRESGGKRQLIKKILRLPTPITPPPQLRWTWKKGNKSELILAKVTEASQEKNVQDKSETEFIIVKEDGVLKIEGTIGDGH